MSKNVKKRAAPENTSVETPAEAIEEIAALTKEGNTSGRLGPDGDGIFTYWELKINSWKET